MGYSFFKEMNFAFREFRKNLESELLKISNQSFSIFIIREAFVHVVWIIR